MGSKVLLVDNKLNTQRMIELTLTAEFLDVMSVGDAALAMHLAEEDPPDLVIADANLPSKKGLELAKELRSHPRLGDVPIILVFDSGTTVDKARLKSVGVNDFIVKPFKSKDLVDKVHALLAAVEAPRRREAALLEEAKNASEPPYRSEYDRRTEPVDRLVGGKRGKPASHTPTEPLVEGPQSGEPHRPGAKDGAKPAAPPPVPTTAPADPLGFDLASLLAGEELRQPEKPKPEQAPIDENEVQKTVFMTRQDLAKASRGAAPTETRPASTVKHRQPELLEEIDESSFTMIMSRDEKDKTKPIGYRAGVPGPEKTQKFTAIDPLVVEKSTAAHEDDEAFHTLIMAKDEIDAARAGLISDPAKGRAAMSPSGKPREAAARSWAHGPPVASSEAEVVMDLGEPDEVPPVEGLDETLVLHAAGPASDDPHRTAPVASDPAIERIVAEAAAATNEELEKILSRLSPDRVDALRKVGGQLIERFARLIVPEVAERLVKEEIERIKKQVV